MGGQKAGRQLQPDSGLVVRQVKMRQHGPAALAQQKAVAQMAGQLPHKKADVHALSGDTAGQLRHGRTVAGQQGLEKLHKEFLPGQTQHLAHRMGSQLVATQGQGLIQQRHAVAHASGGAAGNEPDGPLVKVNVLLMQHVAQVRGQGVLAQVAEDKVLAAADNGDGKLVYFGGGEDEDHTLRRFLQRLEQGVEGIARQHVRLVDDEDLVTPFHGGVADGLAQGAGILDAVVGGTVDFRHVHMAALRDAPALGALVAGFGAGGVLAVEGLGKDAGNGSLAHAACPAEQIGCRHLVFGGGTRQNSLDGILPGHIGKGLGTVTRCEGKVLHGR